MVLVGDVKDKVALIIGKNIALRTVHFFIYIINTILMFLLYPDDMADTCDTLEQATYTLIERGALKVYFLF